MATKPTTEAKALAFHKWCMQEMRYRPRGQHRDDKPPSPDDLKSLFRGQASNILDFLMNNVQSAQTVRKVKGNLQLMSSNRSQGIELSGNDEDNAVLVEKHKALVQELQERRNAISHVEKDLNRLTSELSEVHERHKNASKSLADCRRKVALLTTHSQDSQTTINLYDEFTGRINDKKNEYQSRANQSNTDMLYSKDNTTSSQNHSHNLESACTKNVRESCEHIGSFLNQLLQGKFADSADTLASRKDTLWNVVDKSCGSFPPSQFVLSLSVYAQDSTMELKDKTSEVNIRRDAESLRFKYGTNGHFTDTSDAPSVIQTVSSLLEDAHRENIHRFMETEKNKNSAWKLSERLDKAKAPIIAHLSRSYRGDPGALQLATSLFEKETQVAVCRANLRQLNNVSEELRDRIARATREKEILYSKYQRIQDFTKVVDQKQNLIRVLVKQNLNAKSKLKGQQAKIMDYVERTMKTHEPEVNNHCVNLKDHVTTEISMFASLCLPDLMFITLNDTYKMAVVDMSIKQSSNRTSKCGQTLQEIIKLVDCPSFKAPEYLTLHILKLKTEVVEIEDMLSKESETWTLQHSPLLSRMETLCNEVVEHDQKQLEELLPTLQKRITLATQALTNCLNVKDTVQHWWQQPAQDLTPWLQVEDMTYQQWRDRWTVLATKARQTQIR